MSDAPETPRREHKGYYSIASGKWVTHAEVRAAERAAAYVPEESDRAKRRAAIEARANEAAAAGDFETARAILAERTET